MLGDNLILGDREVKLNEYLKQYSFFERLERLKFNFDYCYVQMSMWIGARSRPYMSNGCYEPLPENLAQERQKGYGQEWKKFEKSRLRKGK